LSDAKPRRAGSWRGSMIGTFAILAPAQAADDGVW